MPVDTRREPPAYKYIRPEDKRAYVEWCEPHIAVFNPVPTSPLYHYTTGSGLIEIIKSGELWATQLRCLNDASEMLYPIELLLAEIHEKLDTPLSDDVRFLLTTTEDKLRKPQLEAGGWFVACFSEDNDDLSQWRAYGGGEGGYAIGFNSLHLRKLGNQFMFLGKVEYDTTKHKAFMADLLNQTIVFFLDGLQKRRAPSKEEWISEFLPCWANFVVTFSPFIKHPKFQGEREWRLVYHFQDEEFPRMRYLQRNSMMTQHVPLQLMMQNSKPRLPLTGIVVGPCRHKEVSLISVGDLLTTYNYSVADVPLYITEIPYRTV